MRGTRRAGQGRTRGAAGAEKPERVVSRRLGWLTALGAVLVVGGIAGLLYVGLATLTSVLLFGWLLLISGAVGLVHAVLARDTGLFWLGLIVAALYLAAGVVVIRFPETTAEGLTLFAALLFLTGGVFRLVGSIVAGGAQAMWTFAQGVVGTLLGVLVLAGWPESTLYVLGTFFSVALLAEGLGLVAVGTGGRHVVDLVARERRHERPAPAAGSGRKTTERARPERADPGVDDPEGSNHG